MKLKLLFFGVLTDVVNGQEQIMEVADATTIEALNALLKSTHPLLTRYKYNIAVNQQIADHDLSLNDGDEIAFLPPFAGG